MISRLAMSLAVAGALVAIITADLQAQACADCGKVTAKCWPAPGHLVACYSWDEWFGAGCDSFEVAFCDGQITYDARVTGSPILALVLSGSDAARTFWNQLGCSDVTRNEPAPSLSLKKEEEVTRGVVEAELVPF